MRVLRGRADTRAADDTQTGALLEHTADTGERAVRVWRPRRQLAFGRRDRRAAGYETACEAAAAHGYPPIVRRVGGRACAYTGETVAFLRTEPVTDVRQGLDDRYEAVTEAVQRACWRLGAPVQRGEPEGAFCPGGHALSAEGKIVGLGQRVTGDAAIVAGTLLVSDHEAIASVLGPVYAALEVPFRPPAVGSLARCGARTDWSAVREELETALVGDEAPTVEHIDK
jgi:octanoyl-[GcvH]:protein N-octanoyltransferase